MANKKEILLAFLWVSAHIGTLFLWKGAIPLLVAGSLGSYMQFLYPVGALIAAAALFSLASLFIRERMIIYGAGGFAALSCFVFLPATNAALAGLAAGALLLFFAIQRIRREFAFSLGFIASKILRLGLPVYFTVISLALALFYAQEFAKQDPAAASAILPRPALDFLLRHALESEFFRSATGLPSLSADMTVDEVIGIIVRDQLVREGTPEARISSRDLEAFEAKQKEEISRQFNIPLRGDEKAGDAFQAVIAEKIEELSGPYKTYLPAVSGVAFFFAFKAFTFPLYLISVVLTFLLIKLMLAGKIIRKETRQIETEKLAL